MEARILALLKQEEKFAKEDVRRHTIKEIAGEIKERGESAIWAKATNMAVGDIYCHQQGSCVHMPGLVGRAVEARYAGRGQP